MIPNLDGSASPIATFRVLGFPVKVYASFFLVSVMLAASGGTTVPGLLAGWVSIAFVSVLWHELGHALVARRFGSKAEISLYAFGGLTHHDAVKPWWQNLAIAVAGPGAGLLLGTVVWLVSRAWPPSDPMAAWFVRAALWCNIGWSCLNLVPILPYDGGLALKALAQRFTKRGEFIANLVSLSFALAAFAWALFNRQWWLCYLGGSAGVGAWNSLNDQSARRRLRGCAEAWNRGDFDTSEGVANAVRASRASSAVHAWADERLGWVMLARGRIDDASEIAGRIANGHRPSGIFDVTIKLLVGREVEAASAAESVEPDMFRVWDVLMDAWCKSGHTKLARSLVTPPIAQRVPQRTLLSWSATLFHAGNFEESQHVAEVSFSAHAVADDAYNVACCECRRGRLDEAIAWLDRAIGAGYAHSEHLERDDDLAVLRSRPEYPALIDRVKAAEASPKT